MQDKLNDLFLCLQIEQAVNRSTVIGNAIYKACCSDAPVVNVLSYVKSQATDNPTLMVTVIGQELTDKILNYNS